MLFHLLNMEKCYLPFRGMQALGRRYTSLHGLLQALKYQDDQYLWLESYQWLRTWQEVRRIDSGASFSLSKDENGKRQIVISFVFKGKKYQCLLDGESRFVESEDGTVFSWGEWIGSIE